MRYDALYGCVAESQGLPFVNLLKQGPDTDLPKVEECEDYLRLRLMPWRREGNITCVAVCEVNFEVMLWLRQRFGTQTRLVITSPLDIARTVMILFGMKIEEDSRLKLWLASPQASAKNTLLPAQRQVMMAYAFSGGALLALYPQVSLLATAMFCHVAYLATMLFKCGIFVVGGMARGRKDWEKRLMTWFWVG